MQKDIAEHNFEILKNLDSFQKLIVDENNKLYIDDRWFPSFRRTYDGSSRKDILDPIKDTFDSKYVKSLDFKLKGEILIHIKEIFLDTYPDYEDLNKLISELAEEQCNNEKSSLNIQMDVLDRALKRNKEKISHDLRVNMRERAELIRRDVIPPLETKMKEIKENIEEYEKDKEIDPCCNLLTLMRFRHD